MTRRTWASLLPSPLVLLTVAVLGSKSLRGAEAPLEAKWLEFQKSVQPFFAKYCFECHDEKGSEKDSVQLDVFRDLKALDQAIEPLEKVGEMLRSHKMPPKKKPQPKLEEVAPVLAWLQAHQPVVDCNGPINPGRVTIRRLNRAEYNNTIRDLLGIDFRPADAFPADDAGYGFDNNGDVLSIAPVLLEKYLRAADLALGKAMFVEPVVAPLVKRWDATIAQGTVPRTDPNLITRGAAPLAGRGRGRGGPALGRVFPHAGEIFADYEFPADGEYIFRFRGYSTAGVNGGRPQVAFRVDNERVRQPLPVREDFRNTTAYSTTKFRVSAGQHRVSLVFLNGATAEEFAAAAALAETNAPAGDSAAPTNAVVSDVLRSATNAPLANPVLAPEPLNFPPRGFAAGRGIARGDQPPVGARGRGGVPGRGFTGPPQSPTGRPILGVVNFEVEGPQEITPDRMPDSWRRVFVAWPSSSVTKEQAAEQIIRNFAFRAYRRPVLDGEVQKLMALWFKTDNDGRPFERSIHVVLQAVLASPSFIFRMESDPQPGEPGGIHTLDEFELATRLSYFLWSTMPDEELFALASKGQLRTQLGAQVRRLLADSKSQALVENFAGQWLQLRQMENVNPNPDRYPTFDEALRTSMIKETQLFFSAIVQEDRSVVDFLDADFTFVNARLASHYGIDGVSGNDFQRVTLTKDQRGGLLTQGSILTLTSYPNRTSPVQRGKWVLENLLNDVPPPPPADVPKLMEDEKAELTGTLRQRMEQHRANPNCAACHERMDAIGFGLENYDGIGAWRKEDLNKQVVDASGTLPDGRSFNGPNELKRILRSQQDQFTRCLTERLLTFALGRGLERYDRCAVDAIANTLRQGGSKFSVLVTEIARSDPFQKRGSKPIQHAAAQP